MSYLSRTLLVLWAVSAASLVAAPAPPTPTAEEAATQKQFFENLKAFCSQKFDGATEFPQNEDHPLSGKLTIEFASCSETELRIPLRAGEDKSRTWVLTLTPQGLLLKHDHRHEDGTPDKVTMYGGWASGAGTPHRQRFAADADTARMLPEAATNVWTLEIDGAKKQLIYALERHEQPRYKAAFDLSSAGP